MNRFVRKYGELVVLQHKIEDVSKQSELLSKIIFGHTNDKATNKDNKGKGNGESQSIIEKNVYDDLNKFEEAISQKVKEGENDTITIEDIHIDDENTSVLSSQEQGNTSPIWSTTPNTPIIIIKSDYPKIEETPI